MTIQFNINDQFAFRLTDHGRYLAPVGFAKPDEHGVYIEQLWYVMQAFGQHLSNGSRQIFEGNLFWVPTEADRLNAKITAIQSTGVAS